MPYTKDFNDSFLNENDDFYNNLDPDYQLPKNKPTEKKRPAANFLQKTSSNDKLFNNDPRYNNILHEPKNEIFFKNLDSENHVPQSNKMPLNPLKSKTISNSNDKTLHDSTIDHNSDELKNVIVLNNQTPPGNKAPSKRTNQLVLDTKNNNVKNKIVTTKKIYYNNSDIENPMPQGKNFNSNQALKEQTVEKKDNFISNNVTNVKHLNETTNKSSNVNRLSQGKKSISSKSKPTSNGDTNEETILKTNKSNSNEIIEKPVLIKQYKGYLYGSIWPWLILLPFAFFFLAGFYPFLLLLTNSKHLQYFNYDSIKLYRFFSI